MQVTARRAEVEDIPELTRLFRLLEAEMADLEEIWPLADGLPYPVEDALSEAMADGQTYLIVGCVDGVPLGFLLGRREPLLPQARGAELAAIRLVFTESEAREVGVGEAMLARFLADHRADGIEVFDAHVAPGHRLAKNFFESAGFSARRIVMNRDDRAEG